MIQHLKLQLQNRKTLAIDSLSETNNLFVVKRGLYFMIVSKNIKNDNEQIIKLNTHEIRQQQNYINILENKIRKLSMNTEARIPHDFLKINSSPHRRRLKIKLACLPGYSGDERRSCTNRKPLRRTEQSLNSTTRETQHSKKRRQQNKKERLQKLSNFLCVSS